MNNKKLTITLSTIILILLIIIVMLLFKSCGTEGPAESVVNKKPGIEYDPNAKEGAFETKSKEEIVAELNEKVALSMINISMNPAPVFESGNAEGNLLIMNNLVNNFPQRVTIIRLDNNEQIYQSKAIPVGSRIETAKLDVNLPAGTYECVAYFDNLDQETGESLGRAGANIVITVNK